MDGQEDDSFPQFIRNDGRMSDWFRTNPSGIFQKSIGLESSLGQSHELNRLQDFEQRNWNPQQFNKTAERKQQNKESSKRLRDKKKQDFQKMKYRIAQLENENHKLRESKVCSWCKRNLQGVHQHYAQICSTKLSGNQKNKKNVQEQLVFQEVQPNKKPNRGWNAKVWIALGIVMLIIGLQLLDVNSKSDEPIRIRQKQLKNWASKLYEEGPGTINIKMKNNIQPQYSSTKPKSSKQYWKLPNSLTNRLQRIQIEPQQIYQMDQQDQNVEQLDLNIDKDLLFSIQAEFDDIGRYN